MKKMMWDSVKVIVIFIACTWFFYFSLRVMHSEFEQYHRYDAPEGQAVKVFNFNNDTRFMDRLNLFFRLGE